MPASKPRASARWAPSAPHGVIDLGHTTPDPAAVHATLTALAGEASRTLAMEASSHGLEQQRIDGLTLTAARSPT